MNLIIAIIGFVLVTLYLNPFEGLIPKGLTRLDGWLRVAYPDRTTSFRALGGNRYPTGFL